MTYKNLNPFNIGIGGLYRGRGFEVFLLTDSVNSFIDYKNAKSANVILGLNFYVPSFKKIIKSKDIIIWE